MTTISPAALLAAIENSTSLLELQAALGGGHDHACGHNIVPKIIYAEYDLPKFGGGDPDGECYSWDSTHMLVARDNWDVVPRPEPES